MSPSGFLYNLASACTAAHAGQIMSRWLLLFLGVWGAKTLPSSVHRMAPSSCLSSIIPLYQYCSLQADAYLDVLWHSWKLRVWKCSFLAECAVSPSAFLTIIFTLQYFLMQGRDSYLDISFISASV
ncbi:hypothetical protein AVEN_70889-1 [Araneus ventricosus]|uniref:Uncharacterized protein n=1 Tax=Araneus ventricosus TaxID=182803 RepID=A0A4Y2V227_ARAVE|nr:hypothetical protein AVEN_70889-1 [Araneus ventricosus]